MTRLELALRSLAFGFLFVGGLSAIVLALIGIVYLAIEFLNGPQAFGLVVLLTALGCSAATYMEESHRVKK